jgi:hypothetical protein
VSAFRVWAAETEDRPEQSNICARAAHWAAEKWADLEDLCDGDELVVQVEDDIGRVTKHRVVASTVIHVDVTPVDEDDRRLSAHDLAPALPLEDLHSDALGEEGS